MGKSKERRRKMSMQCYYNIQLSQAASIHIVFVVVSALFHITTRRNTFGYNIFKYLHSSC